MTLEEYHTLFVLFLTIAILLFVLTAVLFFVFDMRKVIGIKTGWAVWRSIKRLKIGNQKKKTAKNIKAVVYGKKDKIAHKYKEDEKELSILSETARLERKLCGLSGTVRLESEDIESDKAVTVDLKQEQIPEQGKIFQIFETKIVVGTDERIGGNML